MDVRKGSAEFYNITQVPFEDVPFYVDKIPSPQARVLELGCGTGRVLIPMAEHCDFVYGVDLSEDMIKVCKENLLAANLPASKAVAEVGDITKTKLDQKFDLITAPFRVFQLLVEDEQINAYFETVRKHLAPGGTAIVNTFMPYSPPEGIVERNSRPEKVERWRKPFSEGEVVFYDSFREPVLWEGDKLVFYADLTYRHEIKGEVIEEATMSIAMRVHYPGQLVDLVSQHGFEIVDKWGGYAGEVYGEGGEQVIQFRLPGN